MRWLVTVALATTLLLPSWDASTAETPGSIQSFYVLSFNRWGELSSPSEAALIVEELRGRHDIERLILLSHGWANDAEVSYETYRGMVADLLDSGDAAGPSSVVIGIGWDSSQTGFRKLANNLIPFPVLASWLAFLPDAVIFPISFWSKAAQADRIGYGGLRTALNEIFDAAYPEPRTPPEVVLIGHSFGARIVSGLMKEELALARVRAEPFHARDRVRGALLFQPALSLPNLHRDADYPILVTQSRHDHANGFLFPLANVVVNAYSFTSFEGLLRARVFGVVSDTLERGADAVLPEVQLPLPGLELPVPPLVNRPYELFERGMAEIASVPFALAYSAVTTPFNYAVAQGRGLLRNPIDHTMDTLAQLPVVEVLVDGASILAKREVAWGVRSKGFLDLGLLNESPGRLLVAPYRAPREFPVVSEPLPGAGTPIPIAACGGRHCRGLIFVDASDRIELGSFGLSLENRWVDYTLGWLDPIGAHTDYRKPEMIELMLQVAGEATESIDVAAGSAR
jgi:hypothetical protein